MKEEEGVYKEIYYKQYIKMDPLTSNFLVNSLVMISKDTFIASGLDGTIGKYIVSKKKIRFKILTELESSYYLFKLSDNRFLNCGLDDGMTIFSLDLDKEEDECKIEQNIGPKDDPVPMCIELSNGNLISAACYSGSLWLWSKNKDNNYILKLKKDKILGQDGICLFEISDKEIVAISIKNELLFINSNTLEVNKSIKNIKSSVSNTSGICKITDDILAVGGGYGNGIYLISLSTKSLVKQIKLDKEKDVNCIFKLKNQFILTAEYYQCEREPEDNESDEDSDSYKEIVDLSQWKYSTKNNTLVLNERYENIDVASIRSIIEMDNGNFVTGSLSGKIAIWRQHTLYHM